MKNTHVSELLTCNLTVKSPFSTLTEYYQQRKLLVLGFKNVSVVLLLALLTVSI